MKLYEIAFKLSGQVKSSFSNAFSSAEGNIKKINKHMGELNKTKVNIEKYISLKKEVNSTSNSFEAAKQKANELASALRQSDGQVLELGNNYEAAKNKLAQYTSEIGKGKKRTDEQRAAISSLKDEVKSAKEKFTEAKNKNKELGQEFIKTKNTASKLKDKLKEQSGALHNLKKDLNSAGISTLSLSSENNKLAKNIEKTEKAQLSLNKVLQLQKNSKANKEAARSKMVGAVETAVVLKAPIQEAIKFESAMADVRKVVDFESPKQFKQMGNDILKLSKNIPITAEGLAQIIAAGGQAGIGKNELLKYAEAAAKMGVAFDVTAEEAGQTMAQWRSAFKMNQKQVNVLADQINYLGNTTAASAPKITEVVRRIGPLGDVGGTTASSIAALGATMISAGIEEESAATGIKNLILTLTAGEAATKDQAAALNQLGFSSTGMAKAMQKDANNAILQVLDSLKKLPKENQASVLTELFGKESIGAIAPLLTNLDGLRENLLKVGDASSYAGSMEKEFQSRSDTTENKMQLLKNTVTALGTTFGTMLLPPLQVLAKGLAWVTDKVQGFAEKYPGLTQVLTVGTGAILGLSVAWAGLKYAIAIIKSPFVDLAAFIIKNTAATGANSIATGANEAITLKAAIAAKAHTIATNAQAIASKAATAGQWLLNGAVSGAKWVAATAQMLAHKAALLASAIATKAVTAAQWLFNVALNANPIGIVIVLVGLLIGSFVLLYKKSEKVRNAVASLWGGLKTGAESAINFVIEKINTFIAILNKIKIPSWVPLIGGKGINIKQISKVDFDGKPNNKKVGRNAAGTNSWRGGWTWVGERGPELVRLSQGTQIKSHNESLRIARGMTENNLSLGSFSREINSQNDSEKIELSFAPNITVNGDDTEKSEIIRLVQEALKNCRDDMMREILGILAARDKKKERVSFA